MAVQEVKLWTYTALSVGATPYYFPYTSISTLYGQDVDKVFGVGSILGPGGVGDYSTSFATITSDSASY